MQWNCRGVISKWAEIKPVLISKGCDAICLQETHFLPTDNYDFNLFNYTAYNCYSATNTRQGGACIYLSNKWPHFQIELNTQLQAVACSARIGPTRLTICSVYLPPNDRVTVIDLNNLISQLPQPFILCSDANSRHFLWGADRCDQRGNLFEQVIRRYALHVANNGCPTRMDEYTGLWSHIDITLSSSDIGQYVDWHTDDDLHSSDHCPIYISYHRLHRSTYNSATHLRWNLNKANWLEFTDKCDLQFDESMGPENCERITQAIFNAAKETIPQKSGAGKYNCPWWNDECREVIRLRKRALNRFRRSRQNALLLEYKQAKAKARQVIRKAKKDSWQNLLQRFNHTTPISQLWDIIRRFTKKERYRRPLPVLKVGGAIVDDPFEVGNVMGQYFSDLSSSHNYRPIFREHVREMARQIPDFSSDNSEVYNIPFTMNELKKAVTLSGNTSVGPDMIHYAFIKHMNASQLGVMLRLMNYIWQSGNFPEGWKHSTLVPILKPGKQCEKVESYRPIQLTSCLSKLMERMIACRLSWYIDENNMISNYQSAFRKGRSTVDHLVRLDSDVRRGFFYNKYSLAVFLDLKSAYNLTSTVALLSRMYTLGFRGRLMTFLQGYLSGRTFQVRNGVLSDSFEQENGLVQGGVISPILFTLLINDIFADVPNAVKYALYADDCSMWVQGRHILPLVETMQTALDRICRWTDYWGFVFSPPKCQAIVFRRYMKERELDNIPDLRIYNETVTYSEDVKFLGVILDSRLNMKKHAQYIKAKALKRISILKCLSGRNCGADRLTLLRLYKAMIRPILDYGCQILEGPGNTAIESLDSVQNACLRIATGALRTSPIVPLLVESDTYPLRLRRLDLTIRYCIKAKCQENHPCHVLTTNRVALPVVDKNYMRRISGFPLFERLKDSCEELQFVIPLNLVDKRLSVPPWKLSQCKVTRLTHEKKGNIDRTLVMSEFLELRGSYPDYEFIFTDGSKTVHGVGCAFVHGDMRQRFKLPGYCSVFTAEAIAVLRALEYIELNSLRHTVICTDSLSVVNAVNSASSVHPTMIDILERVHRLISSAYDLCLLWIPGHCNITGNEVADAEAKLAIASLETEQIQVHYKEHLPFLRNALSDRFDQLWAAYRPNTTLKAVKQVPGKWETCSRANRREEVVLCRLRLGHTRLTHSYILDRDTRPQCEHCLCPLTIQHILVECPALAPYRLQLATACHRLGVPLCLKTLLGNDQIHIIDSVFDFLRDCQLLNRL